MEGRKPIPLHAENLKNIIIPRLHGIIDDFEHEVSNERKISKMIGTIEMLIMTCKEIKEQILIESGYLK